MDQAERAEAAPSQSLISAEAAHRIAAVANLVKPRNGRGSSELVTQLLRPVRTLQTLVWLSAQAAAGQPRAHATLTAAADELLRVGTRSDTAAATSSRRGASIATASLLAAPALVAATWHVTYLFADAPQRRQALLGALLREAAATHPLALLSEAARYPTNTNTMMLTAGGDLGFDLGDWEPGPLEPDLDLDPFDSDAILDLIGRRHRFPDLVWTDTGYLVDQLGSTFDFDRVYPALRCLEEAARLLELHAATPPPQLTPATWFTGITRLELTGPCPGDTLSVHGSGFGATQPPRVVLLLPVIKGWTPITVPPANWSDTFIAVTLPDNVISGPIGFGDTGYLGVYNAWVDQMNAVAVELANLPCAPNEKLPLLPHWLAPPVGPVNMLTAGEAHILAFSANGGIDEEPALAANVLTPGTPLRLDWKVVNASRLRVQRVGTQGLPVNVTDPTQMSADLGPVDHDEPARFTYRLTVRGPCGEAQTKTIFVYASQRPHLRISGISVGQGWSHEMGIRLVAGKPTLVRVRVRHGLNGWGTNSVPEVTGTLRLTNTWTAITDFVYPAVPSPSGGPMTETVDASITVRDYPDWAKLRHTLNFMMPGHLTTPSDRTAAVRVSVSGYGRIGTFAGFKQELAAPVRLPTFHPRRPLDIRFIPVQWGATPAPSEAICVDLIEKAMTYLPTPFANIAPLWPGRAWAKKSNLGGDDLFDNVLTDDDAFDDLLDDFEDMHHGGAIWVLIVPRHVGPDIGGRAADIPSNVLVTRPSVGTLAHELAHCLNQEHIQLCGADGGDPANIWDSGNTTGVADDWRRSTTFVSPWDLMGYCHPRWPLPKRWNRLFDWIGP